MTEHHCEPEADSHVISGPAGPPMANGELVFEAPWQARLFGIAVSLAEAGLYCWDEFREELIYAVGRGDAADQRDRPYQYYEHFETALLSLLAKKGLELTDLVTATADVYAARPHGHDH